MIDLSGSRGRGFLAGMNGSTPRIREEILSAITSQNQTFTAATTEVQSFTSQLLSASSQIAAYLSSWPQIVTDFLEVNIKYSDWWTNQGRPMQEQLNSIQNNLQMLDEKLTQLGR